MKGFVVIVSAPSGAGKSSIIKGFIEQYKYSNIFFSVSVTTRPPRHNEVNGKDYIFVDETTFKKMIDNDELLEWAKVHNHLYGTPKQPIIDAINKNKICILDIDVQGMMQLKDKISRSIKVFIKPPSIEVLRERLLKRGTDDITAIERRLQNAQEEMKHIDYFDYIIINDDLSTAIMDFYCIIRATEHKNF